MDICAVGQKLIKSDMTRKGMFSFSALERAKIATGIGGDDAQLGTTKGDSETIK